MSAGTADPDPPTTEAAVEVAGHRAALVSLGETLEEAQAAVERGDVLHTDVGFCYLKLCTDVQEMGYVLRSGDEDVPAGLKRALGEGNRWQDLLLGEFRLGRTGNEILAATRAQAQIQSSLRLFGLHGNPDHAHHNEGVWHPTVIQLSALKEQGLTAYEVSDTATGLRMLRAGRVDFWAVNEIAGLHAVQDLGRQVETVGLICIEVRQGKDDRIAGDNTCEVGRAVVGYKTEGDW